MKNVSQMIQDQRPLKGRVGKNGNMCKNGCGIVAIYNAETLLGNPFVSLENIQAIINRHPYRNTVLGGILGIGPWAIKRYFTKRGFPAKWSRLKRVSMDADVYIVWHLWLSTRGKWRVGAHYQAAYRDDDGRVVLTNYPSRHGDFNCFFRSDKGIMFASVLEIYEP